MNIVFKILAFIIITFGNTACTSASTPTPSCKLTAVYAVLDGVRYDAVIHHEALTVDLNLPWSAPLEGFSIQVETTGASSWQLQERDYYYFPQNLTIYPNAGGDKLCYLLRVKNRHSLPLTDPRLQVLSCLHFVKEPNRLQLHRFNEASLADTRLNYMNNGYSPTGVLLRFATKSSKVRVTFKEIEGPHWGKEYGVWLDGVFHQKIASHILELTNPNPQQTAIWEITPSLMNAVELVGIELEAGTDIEELPNVSMPKYFAIGNSITQGVGQGNAGYKAYPFLLGKMLGYETFNLGIGGSKLSSTVANELKGVTANLITILWGFNDWCFESISLSDYVTRYRDLIHKIRINQPYAPLVCIGFINTDQPTPTGQRPINEFRQQLQLLIEEFRAANDENIYYFDASTVDIELMDGVHPSEQGAATLAQSLNQFIKSKI